MDTATLRQAFNGPPLYFTASELNVGSSFFGLPPTMAQGNRRITAGFSYIQRIGKKPAMDVWFPTALQQRLDAMLAAGTQPGVEQFPAEWAALRQFELLQEAGNYKIYDLDASHLTRSLMHMACDMRAGGYRVTVATLGSYDSAHAADDLQILDRRLQDRLSQLIRMLYLDRMSEETSTRQRDVLDTRGWSLHDALPEIGAAFTAGDLFRRRDAPLSRKDKTQRLAQRFFAALSLLPSAHIAHDTAIGLQLPELTGEHEWIYISPGDETLGAFNHLLNDLFAPFGKATATHLRGYGDRLTHESGEVYRQLARYGL